MPVILPHLSQQDMKDMHGKVVLLALREQQSELDLQLALNILSSISVSNLQR